MDDQISFARDHGYVETITGRRRYLKDIESRNAVVRGHSERNAVNAPIQGSAADIIKLAMIEVDRAIRAANMNSKMLLQVHDELQFEVPEAHVDDTIARAREVMEGAAHPAVYLEVPMVVDAGQGTNWAEAH